MSPGSAPVLIVGAGPGGLVLAHALRKNDIPFEIFERDSIDQVRPQGWAVALHDCIPPLRATIPEAVADIQKISVNAPLGLYDAIGVLDGEGNSLGGGGGVPESQPGHILRVRRERLRDYLWQDLPVQCGKRFTHYTEDDDGVTAHLADGTTARGSILVGADGAHSHVRKQLLDLSATDAPYIPILGSGNYPREVFEPIHKLGTAAIALGSEGLRMIVSMLSIQEDYSSANYYWAASFHSTDPEKAAAWAAQATKDELFAKALEITSNIPEQVRRMVEMTGAEGMMKPPLHFVEFTPPDVVPKGRVTILGDAAHSMMPFKGAGVNTAIQDACDLANVLAKYSNLNKEKAAASALQDYAKMIVPRAQKAVAASHAAGEDMSQHIGGSGAIQQVSE